MNNVTLKGSLTTDVKTITTKNNKLGVFFTLAINTIGQEGQNHRDYINCTMFLDKDTDVSRLTKGAYVGAVGSLNNRKVIDRGETRYVMSVVVTGLEHL